MKIIFNDATELQVQQAVLHGDYLLFKTVSAMPEELRKLFEDPVKTKKMTVEEMVICQMEKFVICVREKRWCDVLYVRGQEKLRIKKTF